MEEPRGADPAAGDQDFGLRLQYEHLLRTLDRQSVVLGELRTRASFVLSATGIVASLFGPKTLVADTPDGLAVAALVILAVGLVACLAVLWPVRDRGKLADPDLPRSSWQRGRRRWKVGPSRFDLKRIRGAQTETDAIETLVDLLAPALRINYRTLDFRSRLFTLACVCLAAQIFLWVAILLLNRY